MTRCQSPLRLQPLYPRSNRSGSAAERTPEAVVSDRPRPLAGLDKLPSNRYIYRITEPREGSCLTG